MRGALPVVLVARVLFAPILVVAAALLVQGYTTTGGGFAAGMVASLGWLLQHVAEGWEEAERRLPWSAAAGRAGLAGLAAMAAVLLLPALAGEPPASHVPRPGSAVVKLGILELHTALLFETGVALAVFGFVVAIVRRLARAGERS